MPVKNLPGPGPERRVLQSEGDQRYCPHEQRGTEHSRAPPRPAGAKDHPAENERYREEVGLLDGHGEPHEDSTHHEPRDPLSARGIDHQTRAEKRKRQTELVRQNHATINQSHRHEGPGDNRERGILFGGKPGGKPEEGCGEQNFDADLHHPDRVVRYAQLEPHREPGNPGEPRVRRIGNHRGRFTGSHGIGGQEVEGVVRSDQANGKRATDDGNEEEDRNQAPRRGIGAEDFFGRRWTGQLVTRDTSG